MGTAAAGRVWRGAVLLGLVYLLVVVAFAGFEYRDESARLDRGAYTDTWSPLVLTHLVTLPLSLQTDNGLRRYPDQFDEPVFRDILRARAKAFLVAGVIQAAVLTVLVVAWRRARRG